MNTGYFEYAAPANEPVLSYAPGSAERIALKKQLAALQKRSSRYTHVYRR